VSCAAIHVRVWHLAGTSQLLSAAAAVFRQQGVALAAQRAHSSYQRSIAATLARLRVMHVLEDTSTGQKGGECVRSVRAAEKE
jgi:hypothetical protein